MSAVFVLVEIVKESRARKSVEVFLVVIFTLITNALNVEINGLKAGDGERQIGNTSESIVRNVERQGNK